MRGEGQRIKAINYVSRCFNGWFSKTSHFSPTELIITLDKEKNMHAFVYNYLRCEAYTNEQDLYDLAIISD